jgi:hypothetical protein
MDDHDGGIWVGMSARVTRRELVITSLSSSLLSSITMIIANYVLPPVLLSVDEVIAAMGPSYDEDWDVLLLKACRHFYEEPSIDK